MTLSANSRPTAHGPCASLVVMSQVANSQDARQNQNQNESYANIIRKNSLQNHTTDQINNIPDMQQGIKLNAYSESPIKDYLLAVGKIVDPI